MKKLVTYRGSVLNWECDNVGHMNVMYYINRFEMSSKYLLSAAGLTAKTLRDNNWAVASVRQEINYRQEAFEYDLLYIESYVVNVGNRSIKIAQELRNAETGEMISDIVSTMVILDKNNRSAVYVPELIRLRLVEMMS